MRAHLLDARPPITRWVTPALLPHRQLVADLLDGADEVDVGDRLPGHGGDRLVPLAGEEEVLDLVGLLLVAHAGEDVLVEVHVLGAHAADVEGEHRLHRVERGVAVVGDDDPAVGGDLERLARAAARRAGRSPRRATRRTSSADPRGVVDRQPAVGDLGGEGDVLRALAAEPDRQVLAQRVDDRLQRLAQAEGVVAGVRQRVVRPVAGHRPLAAQHLADDVDVLAGAGERLAERLAVPALDDLRARTGRGRARGARPDRWSSVRACIAVDGRRAAGELHDRRAEPDRRRLRAPPRERREGVRAPRLGREDDVVAELLRLEHLLEVVGGLAAPTSSRVAVRASWSRD